MNKISITCTLLASSAVVAAGVAAIGTAIAQEDESSAQIQSILSNPQTQNILRAVKNNPENIAESVQENSADAVSAAIAIFNDQTNNSEGGVPATRGPSATEKGLDRLENIANQAAEAAKPVMEAARPALQPVLNNNQPPTASAAPPAVTAPPAVAQPAAAPPAVATPVAAQPPVNAPSVTAPAVAINPNMAPGNQSALPVVSFADSPPAGDGMATPATGQAPVQPLANSGVTESAIPTGADIDPSKAPAPQSLKPLYSTPSPKARPSSLPQIDKKENMVITARESSMDQNAGILTFTGDVLVEHPDIELKSEKLVIYLNEGASASQSNFKKLIATGGMVQLKRTTPTGKIQIAKCQRAEYDAITEDAILSGGPPFVQDGDAYINTESNDQKIIMRGNGKAEIASSSKKQTGRHVIVVPIKGGKGISKGPLGGSLNKLGQ